MLRETPADPKLEPAPAATRHDVACGAEMSRSARAGCGFRVRLRVESLETVTVGDSIGHVEEGANRDGILERPLVPTGREHCVDVRLHNGSGFVVQLFHEAEDRLELL